MRRPKMNHWYTPKLALRTGVRVVLSSIFGDFADRRDTIALQNPAQDGAMDPALDYSDRDSGCDGFWFDYMSDTGDGYDATYAMARMLCAPELAVKGLDQPLPRSKVLLLGGDQVYPDPSLQEYQDRFVDPLAQAVGSLATGSLATGEPGPDMYAIPGNHDWYDGLVSFSHLFCRRRIAVPGQATVPRPGKIIADWNTQQTRSYFALRLPNNWWVWAIDMQLGGFVDKSQIEYFAYAGQTWMPPGANVILAVSSPSWVGARTTIDPAKYEQLDYVSRLPERIRDEDGQPKGHRVRLILTGDHHHYARYEEEQEQAPDTGADTQGRTPRNLVVAGGGGAFLHPTHHLDRVERHRTPAPAGQGGGMAERVFRIARQGGRESLYPPRQASRRLAFNNLGFAFLNPSMTASFFVVYLFFIWTLSVWTQALKGETLLAHIGDKSWGPALEAYTRLILQAPFHVALVLLSFAGYYYFTGKVRPMLRWVAGGLHWLAQTLGALLAGWATMQWVDGLLGHDRAVIAGWESLTVVLGAAVAAIVSGTIMGLYLLVQLNVFGRHFNEAFSSIRVDKFRSFLRLHIDGKGGLTLYPIGLRDVPDASAPPRPLAPEAIEKPIYFKP